MAAKVVGLHVAPYHSTGALRPHRPTLQVADWLQVKQLYLLTEQYMPSDALIIQPPQRHPHDQHLQVLLWPKYLQRERRRLQDQVEARSSRCAGAEAGDRERRP